MIAKISDPNNQISTEIKLPAKCHNRRYKIRSRICIVNDAFEKLNKILRNS